MQKLLRQKAAQKVPVYRNYSNAEVEILKNFILSKSEIKKFQFIETTRNARETGERWLMEIGTWTQAHSEPLVKHIDHKEYGRVYYLSVNENIF